MMMVVVVHEYEKDRAKHDVASLSQVTQLHDACAHDVNTQQSTLRMQHLNEEYISSSSQRVSRNVLHLCTFSQLQPLKTSLRSHRHTTATFRALMHRSMMETLHGIRLLFAACTSAHGVVNTWNQLLLVVSA